MTIFRQAALDAPSILTSPLFDLSRFDQAVRAWGEESARPAPPDRELTPAILEEYREYFFAFVNIGEIDDFEMRFNAAFSQGWRIV